MCRYLTYMTGVGHFHDTINLEYPEFEESVLHCIVTKVCMDECIVICSIHELDLNEFQPYDSNQPPISLTLLQPKTTIEHADVYLCVNRSLRTRSPTR